MRLAEMCNKVIASRVQQAGKLPFFMIKPEPLSEYLKIPVSLAEVILYSGKLQPRVGTSPPSLFVLCGFALCDVVVRKKKAGRWLLTGCEDAEEVCALFYMDELYLAMHFYAYVWCRIFPQCLTNYRCGMVPNVRLRCFTCSYNKQVLHRLTGRKDPEWRAVPEEELPVLPFVFPIFNVIVPGPRIQLFYDNISDQ